MNLTATQVDEVIRLSDLGKSQNEIQRITGISKPYVNKIINSHAQQAVNGITGNLPVNAESHALRYEPKTNDLHSSEASYYANRRIEDLELIKGEQRKQINDLVGKLELLQREYNNLKLDYDTQEKKHEYDKNMLIAQHNFGKTQGLSGFADKILGNEKLVELGILMLSRVAGQQGQAEASPNQALTNVHPLANDHAYGTKISEILQVLNSITDTADIDSLYIMFGMFASFPGLLQSLSELFTTNPSPDDVQSAINLFVLFNGNPGLLKAVTLKTEKFISDKQNHTTT